MKFVKWFSILLSIIVLFSILSAGCRGSSGTQTLSSTSTAATKPATVVGSSSPVKTETGISPAYGGTLTLRATDLSNISFDPSNPMGFQYSIHIERLFTPDYNKTPAELLGGWVPIEYYKGRLAESWDQADPLTIVIKLKRGIHWENRAPTNGREFTADDVIFNFDRILGTGNGYTEPNGFLASWISNIAQVTKIDQYSVKVTLKSPFCLAMYDLVRDIGIGPPESRDIGDNWQQAVGTGPWIMTEFTQSVSISFKKNPDYYGYDERFPENKLPYIDNVKWLAIPDKTTFLAALRTYKVDLCLDVSNSGITISDAQSVLRTNPDIKQYIFRTEGPSIVLRVDKQPFNDVRVRKALQMALDIESINRSHYGNNAEKPCGVQSPHNLGWSTPFSDWPSDLQDEYSYNPARAKELLSEAGYSKGFKTSVVANSGQDLELLQILSSYFKDIGIDMEIQVMDMPTMMNMVFSGKIEQSHFFNFSGRGGSPWEELSNFRVGNKLNWCHVDDPEYESILKSLFNSSTVEEAQKYAKMAELYELGQHWTINLFQNPIPVLVAPYINGYTPVQDGDNIAHWWVDQDLRNSYVK